jgi:Ala-tRNA(Pro) deacylase
MNLSLATEDKLGRLFEDCEPGAIPPIGAAYGVPVILDESVCGATDLFFEGGDHRSLVHISSEAFQRLTKNARRARFSHPA